MSLEQAINLNTAAIDKLISILINGVGQVPAAPAKAEQVKQPAKEPAAAQPAPAVKEEPAALDFPSLTKRFQALVAKDRPAAIKLLADLGIAKLGAATLPQYPKINDALKAAGV